jgi:nicotinamidase-related amidase
MRVLPLIVLAIFWLSGATAEEPVRMEVPLRTQAKIESNGQAHWRREEREALWDPRRTAIIVCDMWDQHWCPNAAQRVVELAGPMNAVLKAARAKGVFIIHAPSTTTEFYKDAPQRKRAQSAPFAKTPVPLSSAERFGTCWCYLDKNREAELPIDDSDMGCDCDEPYEPHAPWTRQIAAIEIADEDAITDDGQETWNLLEERRIQNVILMGVHLNMCVLGREFGIRQLKYLGKNVVLMRDMTDTMYNPKMPPHVSHFEGNDLMVEHVEKYWCPSMTSTLFTGKPFFRFQDDRRWVR